MGPAAIVIKNPESLKPKRLQIIILYCYYVLIHAATIVCKENFRTTSIEIQAPAGVG